MFQHWNFVFLFVKKQNKRKTQKIGFKKPTAYIYTYRGYGLDFFLSRPIAWARRRARIFASRELPYRSSTNHYALHEMHARPQLICPLGLHPISPMFRHRTRKLPNNGRFFFFCFRNWPSWGDSPLSGITVNAIEFWRKKFRSKKKKQTKVKIVDVKNEFFNH